MTTRFRTLVFSASALVLCPLGADEIDCHPEGGSLYRTLEENMAAEEGALNTGEHAISNRRLEMYIPPAPLRRTPCIRVGKAGTRSPNNGDLVVTLLVPEHDALTVQEQPVLYWHLSKSTPKTVVLTLTDTDPDSVKPLLEEPLQSLVSREIHTLKLADYGIRLQTNKTYEWSVLVREDPNGRSGDTIARSFIKRVKPNAEVLAMVKQSSPLTRAQGYARNGIWHDALAAVSEEGSSIQAPNKFRHARDLLLEQVGLYDVVNSMRAADTQLGSNL